MTEQPKNILLVDDDEATNFLNEMILDEMGCAKSIHIATDGQKALNHLNAHFNDVDLIMLDINMPRMNGWEFLEKYKSLDKSHRAKIVIIMVTTSFNHDDKEKAENMAEISGFLNKPLTKEKMSALLEHYFDDQEV
ncbi:MULTISPECIES: response regulator [Flammeovirga]|uniref:Response regulator n=1 Tax=Flammeovirga agarivorans TaxID=2726742 RepID=A0A7X8XVL4_9BACT|nr:MULTISPECIES: response regulator [Flammeovirga]NLR91457.1 response regulator [Flammeovirga agarivorans]